MKIKAFNISGLLVLLLLLFPAAPASARLTGIADLSYITYDAEVDGKRELSAKTFQQRYSLMYDTGGTFMGGRLGGYKFALGYEWGAFYSTTQLPDDAVRPKSVGHFLFNGEVVLDPQEIPFKLKVYSRNLTPLMFQQDSIWPLAGSGTILSPGITTDLYNGYNVLSGASLVFGVKNGMTNGYNAIFREIPMLLVDYRDEVHRDLHRDDPMNTRLQKLAFVSLNKKDNWLHFRKTKYNDYVDPTENFNETQVQLGTVDSTLTRRWVDLTNWLQISTDGQFTKRVARQNGYDDSFEKYEFNFFAVAQRKTWEAKSFNYFSRTIDKNHGLLYETRVPLYVNGVWGPDADWRVRTSYEEKNATEAGFNTLDLLGSVQVNLFKRSPFTLTQTLDLEKYRHDGSESIVASGRIETASTRRFSDVYSLFGAYEAKNYDAGGESSAGSYLVQSLQGRATYTPSPLFRMELEEQITHASGTKGSALPTLGTGDFNRTIGNTNDYNGPSSTYSRYVTSLRGEWTPAPRLNVGLTLTEDMLFEKDRGSDYLTTVKNTIDYSVAALQLRFESAAFLRNEQGISSRYLQHSGRFRYTAGADFDTSLSYSLVSSSGGGQKYTRWIDLNQNANYYLMSKSGLNRRLLELTEAVEYSDDGYNRTARFSVGFRYFPTSRLFIAGRTRFSLLDPTNEKEIIYNAGIGITYQKLQASIDYSYGRRDGDSTRKEQRIAANLRKSF